MMSMQRAASREGWIILALFAVYLLTFPVAYLFRTPPRPVTTEVTVERVDPLAEGSGATDIIARDEYKVRVYPGKSDQKYYYPAVRTVWETKESPALYFLAGFYLLFSLFRYLKWALHVLRGK
jgi:hypothetical protein